MAILNRANVSNLSQTRRIDAEYFLPERVSAENLVRTFQRNLPLHRLTSRMTQGPNPKFSDSGLPCMNGKNIYFGTASAGEPNFVTEKEFEKWRSFKFKPNDIVITLKHATKIGRAWVIEDEEPKIFSRNVGLIRLQENSLVNPATLLFYLWSDFAQKILDRTATGGTTGQITLAISALKNIPVPILNSPLQQQLEGCLVEYNELSSLAETSLKEAEQLLLSELGLLEWMPEHVASFVRHYSKVTQSRRIDAEHYQPRYQEIVGKCLSYPAGFKEIGDIALSITNGVESREFVDDGIPYIRVGDIQHLEIVDDKPKRIPHSQAIDLIEKIRLEEGDVLTVRSGSIGQAAVTKEKDLNSVLSSHLMRLRLRKDSGINPNYLALFLSTTGGKEQTFMHNNGGVVPEISQPNMIRIIVPLIRQEVQNQIEVLINKSSNNRKQSKLLLETAKRAVEIAIEENEGAALDFCRRAT